MSSNWKFDPITRLAVQDILKGYGTVLVDDCIKELENLILIPKDKRMVLEGEDNG